MKKYILGLILIVLSFSSCKKEQDPFLVSKHSVGLLTDSTQVKDLKMVFPNDSVINYKGDATFKIPMNMVEVYDKEGKLILILTPKTMSDSTSTITNVRIEDSRFKTEKNISILSTFKEIQDAYKISKIDNLLSSIVISINEINTQFAIDKTELPLNLRYDMNIKFEESQIPDNAKIKYFFINWN